MSFRPTLHQDAEPPAKRRKVEKVDVQYFRSAAEIAQSIRDSDEAGLTRGVHRSPLLFGLFDVRLVLTALRNQLTIKHHETAVGPQDERLLLAKAWMESSPGAQNLFDVWSTLNQVIITF
jgi:nucleolar pre-ribosomal-associated protein 1